MTTPVAGATLYVRTVVTDPFGSYDVTSANLSIVPPSGGTTINTVLTNVNVVADDGCTRTYEYIWHTGTTAGSYNLSVTANEGYEGITATAAANVTLIVVDSGTRGVAEFTSGNNGTITNAYQTNSTVCLRVTDLDQNTNSAAVEFLPVTLTSSAGDSEFIILTETGTNTGVFTACIQVTNAATTNNSGVLTAPSGSLLTLSYTDPDDPTDTTNTTAIITSPPSTPGISMTKSLVTPAGGHAAVGDTVVFNLQVINNGSTILTNVIVTDNYLSNQLS